MIDFTEIPGDSKNIDDFEFFARDLFENLGYTIEKAPARGRDGGLDIILVKTADDKISGNHSIKYLVSCKHNATSNKFVGIDEEFDISGRLKRNGCEVFVGFYSTGPTESLLTECKKYVSEKEIKSFNILDRTRIYDLIATNKSTEPLMEKYFPVSYQRLLNIRIDSNIYSSRPRLLCSHCRVDILDDFKGLVGKLYKDESQYDTARMICERIFFFCESCGYKFKDNLEIRFRREGNSVHWMLISSYLKQNTYIDRLIKLIQYRHKSTEVYGSDDAMIHELRFLRIMYYFVARHYREAQEDKEFASNFELWVDVSDLYLVS